MHGRTARLIYDDKRAEDDAKVRRRRGRKPIPLAVLFRDPGFDPAVLDAVASQAEQAWRDALRLANRARIG